MNFTGYQKRVPAMAPVVLFLFFAALYVSGQRDLYHWLILHWGVQPFAWPFEDTETVMSALRCIRRGVDVYAANPCDPELRPFDYSPLWMTLRVLPVTHGWLNWAGLLVDLCFFASLFLLPVGRTRESTEKLAFAAISTGVFFAVERGNNDLVLFALGACAATLMLKGWGRRCLGFALLFLAGLLKFYPMLTMALALRERPGRFAALALASFAGLALFVALTWHDLSRVLAIIPTGWPFHEMFGSIVVGAGIMELAGLPRHDAIYIQAPMILASLAIAVRLGLQDRMGLALASLTERERSFLLVGALLTISCFFTAQNIGYRVVHMLMVLPALLAMRGFAPSRVFNWTPWAVIATMWGDLLRFGIISIAAKTPLGADAAILTTWVVKESLWWFLVTVLLAYVAAFVSRSAVVTWCLERIGTGGQGAPRAPLFAADAEAGCQCKHGPARHLVCSDRPFKTGVKACNGATWNPTCPPRPSASKPSAAR